MRILVIGGNGFIGSFLVPHLAQMGHSITLFHRSRSSVDLPAETVLGDLRDIGSLHLQADVVIDLILSSGSQARALMNAFHGVANRVVAASSMDVYRACGVLHGSEKGPPEPLPLTEDSPLRTKLQTYPSEQLKMLQNVFGWIDEEYDKIPVERAILEDAELPGTVLRLPMIYGPGDRLARIYPLLKRMDDGRQVILFEEGWAAWRSPRGYVENVAAALALAAVSDQAAGRIYNVAEETAFSELEWAERIAKAAGWNGKFVRASKERLPPHLTPPGNSSQHWQADSSRIRQQLGYREQVSFDEGLRRTIEWQRAHPPEGLTFHQFDYAAEDAAFDSITSRPSSH